MVNMVGAVVFPQGQLMLVITKIISQTIRGMSDNKQQSDSDFETIQLDKCIISKSAKPKIWWFTMHQNMNVVVYPAIFMCLCYILGGGWQMADGRWRMTDGRWRHIIGFCFELLTLSSHFDCPLIPRHKAYGIYRISHIHDA